MDDPWMTLEIKSWLEQKDEHELIVLCTAQVV